MPGIPVHGKRRLKEHEGVQGSPQLHTELETSTPQLPTPTLYADVLLNTLGTHGLIKLRENNTVYVRHANF